MLHDPTRLMARLHGARGCRSPHFVSDVLIVLRERGDTDVALLRVQSPLVFELRVGDARVVVAAETRDAQCTRCVVRLKDTNAFVYADAARTVRDVAVTFVDPSSHATFDARVVLAKDAGWLDRWASLPRVEDAAPTDAARVMSACLGVPVVATPPFVTLAYLCAEAIADAVRLVVTVHGAAEGRADPRVDGRADASATARRGKAKDAGPGDEDGRDDRDALPDAADGWHHVARAVA